MKVTFHIHYKTIWGETLQAVFSDRRIALHTTDGYLWTGSAEFADVPSTLLTYHYEVHRDGRHYRSEWSLIAHQFLTIPTNEYLIYDDWRDLSADSFLYTSAFTVHPSALSLPTVTEGKRRILFRATCATLPSQQAIVAVCGSLPELGAWNPHRALALHQTAPRQWMGVLSADDLSVPFEYKFIIRSEQEAEETTFYWEKGHNRQWQNQPATGNLSALPETEIQVELPHWRAAGTAIPLFALRSEWSFGVGDFGDLKKLVDWAALTRQKAVQILPINDTTMTHTWADSYPYNSISIYAFHPMYMDLNRLGCLKDPCKQVEFDRKRRELNALPEVDYEAVNQAKRAFIRLKYEEDGAAVFATADYLKFFAENEMWLRPYAAYSYLRDLYGTSDFRCWPRYNIYNKVEIDCLCAPESECHAEIAFYYYTQYHLHVQLLEAGNYARERNIILKGDIPIGISRTSVEAWTEPHYFNLDGQAGAPPDPFSANGQNWGFPTYNWERMEQDGYHWWRQRFSKMAEYFTAYRIDHILGFFRIWEIPIHSVHGLLGQFSPALPMSPQEIESFGLPFRQEFYTRPFIDERMLGELFGNQTAWVKDLFIRPLGDGRYEMRPEFATQRQVQQYFSDKNDERNTNLREGLYRLISNVLFVADRNTPDRYHPRIDAVRDYLYQQLSRDEKAAFDRLYEHFYYHRHNDFWYGEAMKKLPVLTQSTPMLVCGEDLGMIPACVAWVMDALRILSLEIERMPKDPRYRFGHPAAYPYRSVSTLSTHDMSTLRGWWRETPLLTREYWHGVLGHDGPVPEDADGNICREIITRQLSGPSMLCILTFQDWTSIDESLRRDDIEAERINVPADPHNYWHYRMHLTLEQLLQADDFNNQVRALICNAGR